METRTRTLVRALIWRVFGVILTVLLTWFFSGGDLQLGIEVGVVYNSIRLVSHYIHDRAWSRVSWGLTPQAAKETLLPPDERVDG